jgi:hypothetical protein
MSNVLGIPAQSFRTGRAADPSCAKRDERYNASRKRNRYASRTCVFFLLAGSLGLIGLTQAYGGEQTCKPALAIKQVQLSAMQPPTMERKWTAIVSADASGCATTAGYFEAGFSRLKENGVELEFREQFIWSLPSVTIGLDFWADEAVESVWIDSVQACPCAR